MRILLLLITIFVPSWAYAQDSLAYLRDDPFGMEQVVVTATRSPKRLKDVPVLTQVISGKQINERGVDNIQDLLMQEVPGLNFQEVGFGTEVDIQGLGAKHVLILIDGERIAGENNGNIDYSRINVSSIERVEIVKGAASALYGSSAMGGVINIITKSPATHSGSTAVGKAVGGNGISGSTGVGKAVGSNGMSGKDRELQLVYLQAGARLSERNQRNFSLHPHVYEKHLDKPNLNANLSLGLRGGNLSSSTDFRYSSKDAYQLYDKLPIRKYFPAYKAVVVEALNAVPTSIDGWQDINVHQKLNYRFGNRLSVGLHGSYYRQNKYDFSADNIYKRTEDFAFGANGEWRLSDFCNLTASIHADLYSRYDRMEKRNDQLLDYRNNNLQPRLCLSWTRWRGHVWTAGMEYFRETLLTDKFGTGNDYAQSEIENQNSAAVTKHQGYATAFLQDEWELSSRLSLTAGFRYDRHEDFGGNFSPKLSAMYKLKKVTLRANYAGGYRSPTIKELWMNWDHLGMFWMYGNPELKPERNNYFSFSAEYTCPWLNISVNIYNNAFSNKIEGVWKNNQTELHYINVGNRRLAGMELMAKLRLGGHFHVHGSYNYLYSKKTGDVQLSSSAPHSGVMRLEYKSLKKDYNTTVNLTTSTIGSKYYDVQGQYTDDITGDVDGEAYYKVHVDAYCLMDFTVMQQIGRRLSLSCGVTNLLDYHADYYNFNTLINPGRKFFFAVNFQI